MSWLKFLDSALSHSLSVAALPKTGMGLAGTPQWAEGPRLEPNKQGLKPTHRGTPWSGSSSVAPEGCIIYLAVARFSPSEYRTHGSIHSPCEIPGPERKRHPCSFTFVAQSVLGDCRLVGEQRIVPEALCELEAAGLDSPREPQWVRSMGKEATGPGDCGGKA